MKKNYNYTDNLIANGLKNNNIEELNSAKYIEIINKMNNNLRIMQQEFKTKSAQSRISASNVILI